jgi:lipopolysaccharide/colanic/teichoic acid biosynthesis glycosyltransferase
MAAHRGVLPVVMLGVGAAFDFLSERVQLCLKRVFDLCAAAVALLTLAPALLLIAILVRFSSRGPVLFRQARVGYRGKEFVMYEFRSMRVEGDPALAALQHVAAQQGVLAKVENGSRSFPWRQDQCPAVTTLPGRNRKR